MKRINYKSDFSVIITPQNVNGEALTSFPEGDFRLVFECGGKKYICGRRGNKYINCSMNSNGTLTCIFDNHGLLTGVLRMAAYIYTPNADYPDGTRTTVTTSKALEIELIDGDGDESTTFSAEMVMPFAVITAYQMAVAAGYTGTEEDWVQLMLKGTEIKDELSLRKVSAEQLANTGDFTNGGNIVNAGDISTQNLDATAKVTASSLEATSATVKNIDVTGKITFFDLAVKQAQATGGMSVFSAGSARIDKIEAVKDASGNITKWNCFMLAVKNGKGVCQMLQANDLCLCAQINSGLGKFNGNIGKWWWRKCTSVTTSPKTSYFADGNSYYMFVISNETGNYLAGSAAPAEGDEIAIVGNTSDTSRQNATIISACSGLDEELQAPYYAQYKGINDFKFSTHRKLWFGYDTEGNADNHFEGTFSVGGGSTDAYPIPREMGEWASGTTYYYYDRVSHDGSLYLMTNKTAGKTNAEPGVSTDWTCQVSKGDEGKAATQIQIKGNANGHYSKASDIDLTTAADGYYLTDTGSVSNMYRCITIVANKAIVNDIDVSDGSCYTTTDGHLWIATAGNNTWTDGGVIKGEKGEKGDTGATGAKGDKGDKGDTGASGINGTDGTNGKDGADAEMYLLVPNAEILKANADGSAYGTLDYAMYQRKGDTFTLQTPSDYLYWRWKTEKNSKSWTDVKTGTAQSVSYDYNTDTSNYIIVELIKGGTMVDRRIVMAVVSNDAYLSINKEMGTITATAQKQSESIEKIQQSTLDLQGDAASLKTRMGAAEASIATSVQYDAATGEITSEVKLSGDKITLSGAVTANNDFSVDIWGNVKTGTQYTATENTYIVEDKSNMIFTQDTKVTLPNDKEFIGRRLLIVSQPSHNSAGVILDKNGNQIKNAANFPKVEITTGKTFVKGVYGYSVSDGAITPDVIVTTAEQSNSPLLGVKWFGGNCAFINGSYYQAPSKLTMKGGYIELLGVSYSVARQFRTGYATVDGKNFYQVHMARHNDDGETILTEPYSEVMTIADGDALNGTIVDSDVTAKTGWESIGEMCQWIVINVNAIDFNIE